MRKVEIKHPDYGKFGKLENSDLHRLIYDETMPKRIDFHPSDIPITKADDESKLNLRYSKSVEKMSIDILKKIFVNGVPLTELYDWKLQTSSFNPHGSWAVSQWHYYMVGSLKSRKVKKEDQNSIEFDPVAIKKSLMEERDGLSYNPNMRFAVMKPIDVWICATNDLRPTNAYYGRSQIYQIPQEKFTLIPGMEILWIHGGNYVLQKPRDKVAYKVFLFKDKQPFERGYGNYVDLWYKQRINDGSLILVGQNIPNDIQFKNCKIKNKTDINELKNIVVESVLKVMNSDTI